MKKKKKLSPGMTLVEVLVSMTIFAVMASAIFSAIAHANKLSNRAKMRDVELAAQTNIIGKKSKGSSEIKVLHPNEAYLGDYNIVFEDGRTLEDGSHPTVDNVKVYETTEGEFDQYFDFKLKTVLQSSSLNGAAINVDNLGTNEYLLRYENTSSESIIVTVSISDGYIYEGDEKTFIHTRNTYSKTIPSGGSADIGYFNDSGTGIDTVSYTVTGLISHSELVSQFLTVNLTGTRKVTTVVSQDGSDPKLKALEKYSM